MCQFFPLDIFGNPSASADMSDYEYESDEQYDYTSDDDNDMDTEVSTPSNAKKIVDYEVVDLEHLKRQQQQMITETADLLQVSPDVAVALLRCTGWSKEVIQNRYYARETPEAFLRECGATAIDGWFVGPVAPTACAVCSDVVTEAATLGCRHLYCISCWGGYMRAKLDDGPSALMAMCLAYECTNAIPIGFAHVILDATSRREYDKWHLRSFVDQNAFIKWCPAPGCQNAIRGTGGECFADCACGFKFCLRCGFEAHPMVHCDMVRAWTEKCASESETANWMVVHTKKCPSGKCGVRIEKNNGCNHMTCKSCRHEFCWICMESWASHFTNGQANYNCNRFVKSTESDISRAKTELERYLHFNARFLNHAKAETYCIEARRATDEKVNHLDEMTVVDYQCVQKAMDLLVQCRRTLKYTFVLGYYQDAAGDMADRDLFEFLQANLGTNTEVLTGLTETPLEEMNIAEIMNYTAITKKFLDGFVEGVEDGLGGAA
ncbi:Aste57867_21185 [Aphanomyces stellatus]|uniref:RBR-type E3 ubiquitin transferase n=1 Tax=Aphanomyces stellatus TaxID=120398 RepID=A0A485LI53_9STRA|nr:hypothetical protein As57867_021117 [Aphanomyces stellatus]VFT97859.1 Aste57867_21185 [Aphanomyces stellatus]